ncbi:hypothetical protein M2158_004894 [Streptomyces sp. SAI-144]|nr:hypothetical protein [Streptomyces sp. SAI-144]
MSAGRIPEDQARPDPLPGSRRDAAMYAGRAPTTLPSGQRLASGGREDRTPAERLRAGGTGIPAFAGRTYILAEAITTDVVLVRAARGDGYGNLVFPRSAAAFNPLAADRAHRHRSRCRRATTGRPEVAPRRGVVVAGQSAGVRATSALPERDGRPSGGVSV